MSIRQTTGGRSPRGERPPALYLKAQFTMFGEFKLAVVQRGVAEEEFKPLFDINFTRS